MSMLSFNMYLCIVPRSTCSSIWYNVAWSTCTYDIILFLFNSICIAYCTILTIMLYADILICYQIVILQTGAVTWQREASAQDSKSRGIHQWEFRQLLNCRNFSLLQASTQKCMAANFFLRSTRTRSGRRYPHILKQLNCFLYIKIIHLILYGFSTNVRANLFKY